MDLIESELANLWEDDTFDEANFSEIEEILLKKPSYVDFFVRKLDISSPQMDTLYLIVLNVVPLETCVRYAIDQNDWVVEDFSEYRWFSAADTFTLMSLQDYDIWLSDQLVKDDRLAPV